MRKAIIFASVFALLAIAGFAAETTVLKVKAASANIRASADTSSTVIKQVKSGTMLEATGKTGNWYIVTVTDANGKTVNGYVHSSLVETADVQAGDSTVFRKGDSAKSRKTTRASQSAQEDSGFHVHAAFNLALSSLTFSPAPDSTVILKSLTGFGGFLGIEFGSGMFVAETNISISPGGVRYILASDPDMFYDGYGSAIVLEVLGKIRFMEGTSPYILVGPYAGYLLSLKLKPSPKTGASEIDILATNSPGYTRFSFGLIFGAGVELPLGDMTLEIGAHYILGLSNFYDNSDPTNTGSVKTSDIVFTLGFKL